MDIGIGVEDRIVPLGKVYVEQGKIICNDLPFRRKIVMRSKIRHNVSMLAFSCTDDYLVCMIEITFKEERLYVLLKMSIEDIIKNKVTCEAGNNPRSLYNKFIMDMAQYSDRKGEFDYAELFQMPLYSRQSP